MVCNKQKAYPLSRAPSICVTLILNESLIYKFANITNFNLTYKYGKYIKVVCKKNIM